MDNTEVVNITLNLVSDKASTNYYNANMGVTLPSSRNATNNIGLSPLFASRNGHSIEWQDGWKYNLTGRGLGGYLWSKTTQSNGYAYYLEFGQDNILPSRNERSLYVFSFRCLVSTNNRIIINLVSDDDGDGGWGANSGVTLPIGAGATHNAGLLPLFINRVGTREAWGFAFAIYDRGSASRLWSKVNDIGNLTTIYILATYTNAIAPSAIDSRIACYSLRCLVSTNNG